MAESKRQVTVTQEQAWSGYTVIVIRDTLTGEKLYTETRMYSKDGVHGPPEPIEDVRDRALRRCVSHGWQLLPVLPEDK